MTSGRVRRPPRWRAAQARDRSTGGPSDKGGSVEPGQGRTAGPGQTGARGQGESRVVERHRADGGTATAELAATLPALMLFLLVALGSITVARDQLACVDAARDVALAVARGEATPSVNGHVVISREGDLVKVTVSRNRSLPAGLPGVTVTATSTAALESP